MKYLATATSLSVLTAVTGCLSTNENKKTTDGRPNIILIMSDDMGYSDIGCFGGEIQTPNLDALAQNGVRFTSFYNTARCCPTRASLLTGLHPHQTGIGHMTNPSENPVQFDLGLPEYSGILNKNSVTIAEVLKEAGYSTMMTGKWHLGMNEREQWPLQRGFDKFYGLLDGASNFFKPVFPRGITFMNDTVSVSDKDFYTTDAFTDYAIRFIGESQQENAGKPFFLYLAYTAPHWPMQAPQEDVDKYKGKYMDGWSVIRERRYKRMTEMGLIDAGWQLSDPDWRDWNSLSEEKKREMDLRRAIYSAMVDRMDQNIGRLTGYLKENQLLDNTVIIFLNDNGACAEGGELGGGPARQLETREGYFLTYGGAWANSSNTPYREYKHWVHEGGIKTPFIVHWPVGIPEQERGSLIRAYGYLPDIMTTCIDLAGTQYPAEFKGNVIHPAPGKSLLPLLKGVKAPIHEEPVFWEHEGNKAVRLGKYKLVSKWAKGQEYNWELFDLEKDGTEMNNLAEEMPDKVLELRQLYEAWAGQNHILPWHSVTDLYESLKEAKE